MDFAELMSKKYLFENKNENETKRGIICKLEFTNWRKINSSKYEISFTCHDSKGCSSCPNFRTVADVIMSTFCMRRPL
ncbi:hypothetical protein JHK87_005542 [Glycine soja]|nr:hypothetical protein JHK87_005542 [Glycine soja]